MSTNVKGMLTSTKSLENHETDQKRCILSRKVYLIAIGQGFHGKPSPTLGSLPAGLKNSLLKNSFFLDWQSSFNRSRSEICRFAVDETFSRAVLKGFQSLQLVSSLSNRLKLLEFQATAKTRSSFCPERALDRHFDRHVAHCSFTTLPFSQSSTKQLSKFSLCKTFPLMAPKKGETYSPTNERGICNSLTENLSSARLSWKSRHHANLSPRLPSIADRRNGKESLFFEEKHHQHEMSIHNFDHMEKRTYMHGACVSVSKMKGYAYIAFVCVWGDLVSCVGVYGVGSSSWSFDIGLTMSCVKMCCHSTLRRQAITNRSNWHT